jgi:FkbM family methyltransferase
MGLLTHANAAVSKFGVRIARTNSRSPLAGELARVCSLVGVDHVIDVGAHHGEFGRMMRTEIGFRGRIDSFEPVTVDEVRAVARDDDLWHVTPSALGDRTETATIHVQQETVFSSLHPMNTAAEDVLGAQRTVVERQLEVGVRRLDDIDLRLGEAVLLKVDTQGHDLSVLAGATRTLQSTAALLIEIPFVPIYEGTANAAQYLRVLENYGFLPVGFFPIVRLREMELVEADGLFVRSPHAVTR